MPIWFICKAANISIHAPRTGSDTRSLTFMVSKAIFQSTLPARGATSLSTVQYLCYPISIHAPRTGSDQKALKTGADPVIFQSTLPARGATLHQFAMICPCLSFQSTLPARGATVTEVDMQIILEISIHAPRTGSDMVETSVASAVRHFNPRSPHGERPPFRRACPALDLFQSTLPARGATATTRRERSAIWYFNPRSPHGERHGSATVRR